MKRQLYLIKTCSHTLSNGAVAAYLLLHLIVFVANKMKTVMLEACSGCKIHISTKRLYCATPSHSLHLPLHTLAACGFYTRLPNRVCGFQRFPPKACALRAPPHP